MFSKFIVICLCGQYFRIHEVMFQLCFLCGKHIRASESTTFVIEVPYAALWMGHWSAIRCIINVHFKPTVMLFSLVLDCVKYRQRCECCVLSGRGLCDELITRPEESYRLWCVFVCDLEGHDPRWAAAPRGGVQTARHESGLIFVFGV
jgi:hypothetical protein